jgi:MFS family permease
MRNFNITHGIWLAYLVLKGFSLWEIGLFEGVFHLSSLTMEVPTGIVADLYGRKLSRIISLILYVVYLLILLFASNFILIAIAFFICGLSYTFESGSGEALVYDSLILTGDEQKYMKIIGKKEVLYQASSGIALLIGGYIAVTSYNLSFILMVIVLTTGLIPILMMKETVQKTAKSHQKLTILVHNQFVRSTKVVFSDKKLLFLIIIGALLAAPITSVFFYFQIHLLDLKFSLGLVGLLLGAHSVFGAIGGYFSEKIESKFKERLVLYIIPIFIIFSFFLIQVDMILFIPFVLLGFLDSVFYVVLGDYINKLVPTEVRASILSFNSLAFSIIMIVMFPALGYIGDLYGLKFAFLLLAGVVLLAYLFLIYVLKTTTIFHNNSNRKVD